MSTHPTFSWYEGTTPTTSPEKKSMPSCVQVTLFPTHGSGSPGSAIARRCKVKVGMVPNRSLKPTGNASIAPRSTVAPPIVKTSPVVIGSPLERGARVRPDLSFQVIDLLHHEVLALDQPADLLVQAVADHEEFFLSVEPPGDDCETPPLGASGVPVAAARSRKGIGPGGYRRADPDGRRGYARRAAYPEVIARPRRRRRRRRR